MVITEFFGGSSKEVCRRVKAALPDHLRNWVGITFKDPHWIVEAKACDEGDLSRFVAAKPAESVSELRMSVAKGSLTHLADCLGFTTWPGGCVDVRDHYACIRLTPALLTDVTEEQFRTFLAEALISTLRHNNLTP